MATNPPYTNQAEVISIAQSVQEPLIPLLEGKADAADITSTIGITYDLLDPSKNTYTNVSLANKQVALISNETTTYPILTFDSSGVLPLGFTASSGFVGILLGSLGTSVSADEFLQFLTQVFKQTFDGKIVITDAEQYIGLLLDNNGLTTGNINSNKVALSGGYTLEINGDDGNILSVRDTAGYYAFKYTTDGILYVKGINLEVGLTYKLKDKIVAIEQDSFGVVPRPSGGITADNVWWKKLVDKTGCVLSYVDAIGGTCVTTKTGVQYATLDSRVNSLNGSYNPSQVEVIFAAIMTNDAGTQNSALGSITDTSANPNTFYGAYKLWIEKLQARYVNAIIFPIISTLRNRLGVEGVPMVNSTTGFTYNQFRLAIIQVAALYQRVYPIDMSKLSYIDYDNMGYLSGSTYIKGTTEDGLHMLAPMHDDYATKVIEHTQLYL